MASPSSRSSAETGTLSITLVIATIEALAVDLGKVSFLTARPAVLTEEPPLRSPLHIDAAQKFDNAIEVLNLALASGEAEADDIREAEGLVDRLGKQLKRFETNDRYLGQEYQRLVAQYAAYKDMSAKIEDILGPTLMKPAAGLFTGVQSHVGLHHAIHVPIHELMSDLLKLKMSLSKSPHWRQPSA